MTIPTFGSLFAGIGGIDLGLERAGWKCSWQVENDPYCQKILAKHWPSVPRYGDIEQVADLPSVDLIAGGFPCQDVSHAGKREGIQGSRSGLWTHFARIIRLVRPRFVLVENVPGLLVRGMGTVLGDLAGLGYDTEWDSIPAAAVGAPHLRYRIFIVAYAQGGGTGSVPARSRHEGKGEADPDGRSKDVVNPRGARREPRQPGTMGCGRQGRDGFADGGSDVPDSHEQHDDPRGYGTGEIRGERSQASEIRRGEQEMADAQVSGLQNWGSAGESPSPGEIFGRTAFAGFERCGGSWWATEPGICGMANGISQGLDGGINGHPINADEAREQVAGIVLRVLRSDGESSVPSPGWRSDEQLARELTDALRDLPYPLALGEREATLAAAQCYVSCLRKACEAFGIVRNPSISLSEAWTSLSKESQDWTLMAADDGPWWAEWPHVARVATKIPGRVDRLKGLGNAVVPQVAEWIGRRLMQQINPTS